MRDYSTFRYFADNPYDPASIKEGTIFWLPKKERIPEHLLDGLTIDDDGCGHPVAILTKNDTAKQVRVAIITSFDGTDLIVRHSVGSPMRAYYLPIWPSDVHPDSGLRLHLEDNAQLPKRSYVNINKSYVVDPAVLKPFDQSRYRLSLVSMAILAKHLGFKMSAFTPQTRPLAKQIQSDPLLAPRPYSNIGAVAQPRYPDQSYNRLYSHVVQSYDHRTSVVPDTRPSVGVVRTVPETRPLLPQSHARSRSTNAESSTGGCSGDCCCCCILVFIVLFFICSIVTAAGQKS